MLQPSFSTNETTSAMPDILPNGYKHLVTSFTKESDVQEEARFTAVIRLALDSREAAMEWLKKFETTSYTTMSVQKTYPHCKQKNVFRVDLCCHHHTHPRAAAAEREERRIYQSRHTACPAVMSITVKRIVPNSRSKDAHMPAFPMIVVLKFIHNHPVMVADALKHRKVSEEIRSKFLELFKSGHSPTTALESHRQDLQEHYGDNYAVIAADRSLLPDRNWCYRLFYATFCKAYGSLSGETLQQDLAAVVDEYNKTSGGESAKMLLVENEPIVAICTPLMKRILANVKQSGELVIMDSTGNVDRDSCRIFLLMTHCAAGGIPIGCFLTTSQAQTTVEAAFESYKELLSPDSFDGRGVRGPQVMMTDDCNAEKNAVATAFPEAVSLLSAFHLLQSTWRWLWDDKHAIPSDHRPELFNIVKRMMYASNRDALEELYAKEAQSTAIKGHPAFAAYLAQLYKRRQQWAICYHDTLDRGDFTNNFCEAVMRVMKDNMLARTKTFNLVQLFNFVVHRMEHYYERRIQDTANGRSSQRSRCKSQKGNIDISAVKQLAPSTFQVPSESQPSVGYTVDMQVGICSCPVGVTGRRCKHQAAVAFKYKLASSNQLTKCSPQLRDLLCSTATGRPSDGELSLFPSLNEENESMLPEATNSDSEIEANIGMVSREQEPTNDAVLDENNYTGNIEQNHDASDASKTDELLKEFTNFNEHIMAKVRQNPTLSQALRQYLNHGRKIMTDADLLHNLPSVSKRPRTS